MVGQVGRGWRWRNAGSDDAVHTVWGDAGAVRAACTNADAVLAACGGAGTVQVTCSEADVVQAACDDAGAVQAVCANALVLGNVARDLDVMLWGRGVFVWVCCPGAVWERSRNSSECQFLEIEFHGITTAFPSVPPSVCAPCDF